MNVKSGNIRVSSFSVFCYGAAPETDSNTVEQYKTNTIFDR